MEFAMDQTNGYGHISDDYLHCSIVMGLQPFEPGVMHVHFRLQTAACQLFFRFYNLFIKELINCEV